MLAVFSSVSKYYSEFFLYPFSVDFQMSAYNFICIPYLVSSSTILYIPPVKVIVIIGRQRNNWRWSIILIRIPVVYYNQIVCAASRIKININALVFV